MSKTIESYPAHTQMLENFQTMFPNLCLPHIDPHSSIFESLNSIVSRIPRPSHHHTFETIKNMKNYVDGQQLRIQMNMIQIDEAQENGLQIVKKMSNETRDDDDSWEERPVASAGDWVWEDGQLQYQDPVEVGFPSFID